MDAVYAIWLMPHGQIYAGLNKLIVDLSKKFGTVEFEPHMTLHWPITGSEKDVLEKTAKLASLLSPFNIELQNPEVMDEYFRCIFLPAQKSDYLVGANKKAREIFSKKPPIHEAILRAVYGDQRAAETIAREKEPGYGPHLSIMYGTLPQNIKASIIKSLNVQKQSFSVNSLHLYETGADPKEWKLVKRFTLGV